MSTTELTPVNEAKERLAADLRKVRPFPDGTLIRWSMTGSNGVDYSFAAMFAGGSWYTTAQQSNPMVDQKMSHSKLLNLIASNPHSVHSLEIAAAFDEINL